MDIEGLSMALAQSKVMTDVSTQVLAMSLDHITETGSGMVEMLNRSMMENSVMPHLGSNFDMTV